jgi:hypothetical protein
MPIDPESHAFRIKILEDELRALRAVLPRIGDLEDKLNSLQLAFSENGKIIESNSAGIKEIVSRVETIESTVDINDESVDIKVGSATLTLGADSNLQLYDSTSPPSRNPVRSTGAHPRGANTWNP